MKMKAVFCCRVDSRSLLGIYHDRFFQTSLTIASMGTFQHQSQWKAFRFFFLGHLSLKAGIWLHCSPISAWKESSERRGWTRQHIIHLELQICTFNLLSSEPEFESEKRSRWPWGFNALLSTVMSGEGGLGLSDRGTLRRAGAVTLLSFRQYNVNVDDLNFMVEKNKTKTRYMKPSYLWLIDQSAYGACHVDHSSMRSRWRLLHDGHF